MLRERRWFWVVLLALAGTSRAQLPILSYKSPPSMNIEDAAFAPDGHTLMTVSSDGRLVFWDPGNLSVTRQIRRKGTVPRQGKFLGNNSVVVSEESGLYSYSTNQSRAPIKLVRGDIESFTTAPANSSLAYVKDHSIVLRSSGGTVRILGRLGTDVLEPFLTFNKAGTLLAALTHLRQVSIWSTSGTRRTPLQMINLNEEEQPVTLSFNAKNELIAVLCKQADSRCGIAIKNLQTRIVIAENAEIGVQQALLSSDFHFVAVAGRFKEALQISILRTTDLATTRILVQAPIKTGFYGLRSIPGIEAKLAFSPDGSKVAMVRDGYDLSVYDLSAGRVLKPNGVKPEVITGIQLADKANVLVTDTGSHAYLWDLRTGIVRQTLETSTNVRLTPNGAELVYFKDNRLTKFNLITFRETQIGEPRKTRIEQFAILSSSRIAVVEQDLTRILAITAVDDGERLPLCIFDGLPDFAVADGKIAAVCRGLDDNEDRLRVWSVADATQLLATFPAQQPSRVVIDPSGGYIATISLTGQEPGRWFSLRENRAASIGTESYSAVAFDPKGNVVLGTDSGGVELRAKNGNVIFQDTLHSGAIECLAFLREMLVSCSDDGSVVIRSNDRPLRLMLSRSEGVAVDSDGLFDGNAGLFDVIGWRRQVTAPLVPLESFFDDFYSPRLLPKTIAHDQPRAAKRSIATVLNIAALRPMIAAGLIHILPAGAHKTRLCLPEDSQVAELPDQISITFRGEPLDSRAFKVEETDLEGCHLSAVLQGNVEDYELFASQESEAPNLDGSSGEFDPTFGVLHLQTIGIDNYPPNSGLKPLRYSENDANQIEQVFRESITSAAQLHVWPSIRSADAKLDSIRDRLNEISATALPDDIVVLYLAGHGTVPPGQQMFYFLPVDVVSKSPQDQISGGLSAAMLAEFVRTTVARRILIIMDSCQSGGSLESLQKAMTSKQEVSEPGASENGAYAIAATTPLQLAIEQNRLGHGLLTEAIAQSKEKFISVKALTTAVRSKMQELTKDLPRQQTPMIISVGTDFPLRPR